jgi:hypothetical protein
VTTPQTRDSLAARIAVGKLRPRVKDVCAHQRCRPVVDADGQVVAQVPNRYCPNCGVRLSPPTLDTVDQDRALIGRLATAHGGSPSGPAAGPYHEPAVQ